MVSRRAIALAFVPVLVAVGAAWYLNGSTTVHPSSAVQRPSVIIGGQSVAVDLATTEAERAQGLGGRAGLSQGEGMLFVFAQSGEYSFWMKDMRFAIDIVWLDAEGSIVTVLSGVSPASFPKTFSPTAPARYVLELPAGFSAAHGVREGQTVTWADGRPLSLPSAK